MSTARRSSTGGSGGGSMPTMTTGRLPRDPVHAAWFRMLGHLRQECHAAAPGSAQGLYLIVSDIAAARDELLGRGVEVSEVFHNEGVYAGPDEPYLFGRLRVSGPDPSIAATARSPRSMIRTATAGCSRRSRRGCPGVSPGTRRTRRRAIWRGASACRGRPRAARGAHRREADENWPDWYAEYMVREQSGEELPK